MKAVSQIESNDFVFSASDIQEDCGLVAKDDNLDAGKSNRDKNRDKEEKEEAEVADDRQGQDKINEQIDEVMRI